MQFFKDSNLQYFMTQNKAMISVGSTHLNFKGSR